MTQSQGRVPLREEEEEEGVLTLQRVQTARRNTMGHSPLSSSLKTTVGAVATALATHWKASGHVTKCGGKTLLHDGPLCAGSMGGGWQNTF